MMFSPKSGGSRTAAGLLCCLLLMLNVAASASQDAQKTEGKRAEEDLTEEAENVAAQTDGERVPSTEEEPQTREERTEIEEGFVEELTGQTAGMQIPEGEEEEQEEEEEKETTRAPTLGESATEDLCSKPLPPENGFIKGDNYSYEAVVRVGCEAGYKLSGPSTLTCLPVPYHGAPGVWVPQDEYRCLPAASVYGTEATYPPSHLEEDAFDEREEPYVAEGAHLDEYAAEREASFEDIRCPKPMAPANGRVIGTDYSIGATVTFACDEGYTLIGPDHATCFAVPDPFHHRAIWDPPLLPSCQQVSPAPPCLLPDPEQDSAGSEFNPRLQASAEILTNTVPDTTAVEGLPYLCALPMEHGSCRDAIQRYFFDATKLECLPFNYGGCQGNDNNFETFEDCQHACR